MKYIYELLFNYSIIYHISNYLKLNNYVENMIVMNRISEFLFLSSMFFFVKGISYGTKIYRTFISNG